MMPVGPLVTLAMVAAIFSLVSGISDGERGRCVAFASAVAHGLMSVHEVMAKLDLQKCEAHFSPGVDGPCNDRDRCGRLIHIGMWPTYRVGYWIAFHNY